MAGAGATQEAPQPRMLPEAGVRGRPTIPPGLEGFLFAEVWW